MIQPILTSLFFLFGIISSVGQDISEDVYCIKLKNASTDKYFSDVNMDSIPPKFRTLYERGLNDWGKQLSRFSEEPLQNSKREVFRSITFGPFNNLSDIQVLRIEKWDNKVEVTVKFIQKLKDSTILVHKKILGIEVWDKFEEIADKYFTSRPSNQSTRSAIHDGTTTVFEGHLSNRYHFLQRHVMSATDPELKEVNTFLIGAAGNIFGIKCKTDTREN